ncbi:hypothetical protein [Micromonospora sp. DT47]|uniref:hypothetical protein n=1 Tax=Micromonospora sp. DT47 TaxID=3393431 RepID=UPI003CF5B490
MIGNSSAEQLAVLAGHKQVRVRVSVASDPAAAPELLAKLASDPSRSVRRVVASRPDTTAEALRGFVSDPDRQTREALAANPGCPKDTLVSLLVDPHWSVRWAVVDNPGADVDVRRAICQSRDKDMRFILAQMLGLEDEIVALLQHDASVEVRTALAEQTDSRTALDTLLADPAPRVRAQAGMNPHTTADQRRRLVRDPAWEVRNSVVWSKATHGWQVPEEDLLVLARDRSVNVRYWLANLPGATPRVYGILAEDTDEMVANAAQLWLLSPDSAQHPNNHVAGIELDLARLLGSGLVRPGHAWGPEHLGQPIPHLLPSRAASMGVVYDGPADGRVVR